ncbi:uncharacterized protein SCHCODRAFT_02334145 [Schizophyllum commune H4-8]|uniref:uncharacterized protein n=1 Tax=Schizophyllum commune (strain H4-8 / FGSC 9210) TaxID=578458 RepID=UPI00215E2451|nr:uncharacterized protein SCHCODRAFT_02334145 [Schizophyllum commune H4-8]KAI5889992.1 hypothetical protein SCHCODRAFT_02334145 [Schizophyllum commune H4-8]
MTPYARSAQSRAGNLSALSPQLPSVSSTLPRCGDSGRDARALEDDILRAELLISGAEVSSVKFPRVGKVENDEDNAERGAPLARALSSTSRPSQWSNSLIAHNSTTTSNFLALFRGHPGFVTRHRSLYLCFLVALLLSCERWAEQASKETPFALENAAGKAQRAAPASPTPLLTNATP